MENNKTIDEVIVEVVRRELSNAKKMLTALIIVTVLLFISMAGNVALIVERLSWETVTETEEDTYSITAEGNDNNFVSGDQYNDSAVHNEGTGDE